MADYTLWFLLRHSHRPWIQAFFCQNGRVRPTEERPLRRRTRGHSISQGLYRLGYRLCHLVCFEKGSLCSSPGSSGSVLRRPGRSQTPIDPPASALQMLGIKGVCHHVWLGPTCRATDLEKRVTVGQLTQCGQGKDFWNQMGMQQMRESLVDGKLSVAHPGLGQ